MNLLPLSFQEGQRYLSPSSVGFLGREVWRRKETTSTSCLPVPTEASPAPYRDNCLGKGGQGLRTSPVLAQQDAEKFSWDLFIVSIIPGNEDSAIRTHLAVVLGTCEANRIPGLQEGRPVCQDRLKAPLGTRNVM